MPAESVWFPHTAPASQPVVERIKTPQRFQVRMRMSVALPCPVDTRVMRLRLQHRRLVYHKAVAIGQCAIDVDSPMEEIHMAGEYHHHVKRTHIVPHSPDSTTLIDLLTPGRYSLSDSLLVRLA